MVNVWPCNNARQSSRKFNGRGGAVYPSSGARVRMKINVTGGRGSRLNPKQRTMSRPLTVPAALISTHDPRAHRPAFQPSSEAKAVVFLSNLIYPWSQHRHVPIPMPHPPHRTTAARQRDAGRRPTCKARSRALRGGRTPRSSRDQHPTRSRGTFRRTAGSNPSRSCCLSSNKPSPRTTATRGRPPRAFVAQLTMTSMAWTSSAPRSEDAGGGIW
jgi:hypothetical protein